MPDRVQEGIGSFLQVTVRLGGEFTSTYRLVKWGEILHDEVMAAALLDRLLHRCHIVNIRGWNSPIAVSAEHAGNRGAAS